jgi:hypothetical protein
MYPPPAIRTSQAELIGTTAGIIATLVVATVGLAVMLGMVYWAASHPGYKRPAPQPRPPQATANPVLAGNQRFAMRPDPQDQADGAAGDQVREADGAAEPVLPQGRRS